jgi:c-di-GMP-binding flagellar brake protein YcgR
LVKPGDPVERRKHERVSARVPLYVVMGGEIFQKMIELETQNISAGGLGFETHREIPLEAESLVMVSRLGDLPPSAQIQGRVVHCHHDAERDVYMVGVTFTKFEGVTPEELNARIEAWRKARSTQATE